MAGQGRGKPGARPVAAGKPRPAVPLVTQGAPGAWRDKLHPRRFPSMSPKMAAIIGHVTDQRHTTPHIAELETTSDGLVMARAEGDTGMDHIIGHVADLHQNWSGLLDSAGLTPQERSEANAAFSRKLKISVSPLRRGLPESINERFESSHRGWLAPDGTEHRFGDFLETHPAWANKNRELVQSHHQEKIPETTRGIGLLSWMLARGWTRKVHSNQYHVKTHAQVPAVMAHVRAQHPEVKHADVIVGNTLGDDDEEVTYKLPTARPPGHWLRQRNMEHHRYGADDDLPDEFNLRAESTADELISESLSRSPISKSPRKAAARSWIDPKGKIYPLRGISQKEGTTYHPEWVEKHQDLVKKHAVYTGGTLLRRGRFDRMQTMVRMMVDGWIRKASPTRYDTGADHLDRVVQHFRERHKDEHSARVRLWHRTGRQTEHVVRHDRVENR